MDAEQIANIFSDTSRKVIQYSDAQWLYIQDNNNSQYSNFIQWFTTALKQQFIDYHNGWFQIPARIEILNDINTGAQGVLENMVPPVIAMRESILSLFGNIVLSTDQGQTLFNDNMCHFINNLRLQIENNLDWVHCNGSNLDFAYDMPSMTPATNTSTTLGPDVGYQQSNSALAFQGQSPVSLHSSPITNDYNEYGNNLPGTFSLTTNGTSGQFTAINGVTAAANTNGLIKVTFPWGQVGFIPYISTGGSSTQTLTSLGGITLATYNQLADGTYNVLALGTAATQVQPANYSYPSQTEVINAVVTIQVTSGSATYLSVGGINFNTASTQNAQVNGQIGGRNPLFNKGFLDRATIFQNTSSYQYVAPAAMMPSGRTATNGGHVWQYLVACPLKMLHDFWASFNFANINVGYNIQLFLLQTNGSTPNIIYPPLQTAANTTTVVGGVTVVNTPAIYYGQGISQSGCRLYYRAIKFSPEDNARMAARLTAGFTKAVKFISTDWIIPSNNIVAPGSATIQMQLEQSCVHPIRVWMLSFPNTSNISGGVGSFLQSNTYATGVIPGWWTNTNILVNNVPYWRQNFQTFQDMWEQVKEQFNPDTGSMLRYVDWRNYKRILCFDLTRIADRLPSPTEPVSLQFQGQRADNLLCNLEVIFLVERDNQATFRFSSSDVAIVVGNLD